MTNKKDYTVKEYTRILKEINLDKKALPEGVSIYGEKGHWNFKDIRTIYFEDEVNKDGYPIPPKVFPLGFTDKQVYIVCPHCNMIHKHGGSIDDEVIGHRISHCADFKDNPGYEIEKK